MFAMLSHRIPMLSDMHYQWTNISITKGELHKVSYRRLPKKVKCSVGGNENIKNSLKVSSGSFAGLIDISRDLISAPAQRPRLHVGLSSLQAETEEIKSLRACAPVKLKGDQPYNRSRNPAKFRELGDSDDSLDMDTRGKLPTDGNQDVVPMPPGQSKLYASKGPTAIPAMILPDDMIQSPTFPRPGETIGRKKGKQLLAKCKCCERDLTKEDKDKSLLSKYVKCATCKGNVCIECRDRDNRCHECYVQKSVSLDPNSLMEFQRTTLLRFLEILHYNETMFEDFDKAHLVKQLLTRFRVHELWDPRFHADPLEIEELKKKKEAMMAEQAEEEKMTPHRPLAEYPIRNAQSLDDQLDEKTKDPYQQAQSPYKSTQKPGRNEFSYKTPGPLLLQNISSPKQLEDLEVHELRAILNQYSVDSSGERPVIKYRVLQLWNSLVDKDRKTPSPNFSRPPATNLQRTFSLKDIPTSSAIEKLTITQMKNLLLKYNHDPEMYPHRSDLEYQVTVMWNSVKREALRLDKEKKMPGLNTGRNWKSQENVHGQQSKWTSAVHAAKPVKDKPDQYGSSGYGNWGDINRYQNSPEHNKRGDLHNPYQNPILKSSTLPRTPPVIRSTPPEPPPLPPPAPHLLKSLALHDISKPEEISSLSMKQMIGLLDDHAVNTDGASDKAHLEDLVKQLWFDKIMPERYLNMQPRSPNVTYHHSQTTSPSPYQVNTSYEKQFGAMTISKQKYSDGDNSSMSSMTQQTYYNQEPPSTQYKPYGNMLPKATGPLSGPAKKPNQEMCTVCLVRPIDCIILNCSHMVSCMSCLSQTDACPLCHSEITRVINIK